VNRIGWLASRLGAMSPGEIAHRAGVAVRDRFFVPAWERDAAAAAFARLFRSPAREALAGPLPRRWVRRPTSAVGFASATAEAAAIAGGHWRLFGHEVAVTDPPRWSANALSGVEWPEAPSREIDCHHAAEAGGAKFAWELGRLTSLPSLALATRVGGDPAHAARAARWLADFAARAPLGHGIHHASGIECALRVLTTSATLALLEPAEAEAPEAVLGLLAQQALWCRDHLSLGSSANNHLLAELSAMVVAGSLWPSLRPAKELRRAGLARLERELLRQYHPDGTSAEQAFGYVPFIWELALLALSAAECAGEPVRPEVWARLGRSLEFMRAVRLPCGHWPQVGDEDDGRVLLAWDGPSRLDLVGNALAARLAADPLDAEATGLAALLFGAPGHEARAPRAAADGVHRFPDGGWTVWRERGLLVTFDHGPLGLGSLAAHGHADALSVTVWNGDDGLVVDPGTFAYQEDEVARERCRSTPVHSTVHFGGRSQSRSLGPFLWGRRAEVAPAGEFQACTWASGERHERSVEVADGVVTLVDRVHGDDAHLVFALAPGAVATLSGARADVTAGASRASFLAEGLEPWKLEPAEHAPRFSQRTAALRLTARLRGAEARTRIETGPAR
jgi:hypothetical protein